MYISSYAESIGATLFVTSAKAGTGIDDIFSDIAKSKSYCVSYCFQFISTFLPL